jgi:ribosome-binding protein aMBF1 (putative translation factor)
MNECFKCGISGEKARLFDVISDSGIVKVCNNCFSEENLPLIKKPTTLQIKESEKQRTFHEKISTSLANKIPVRKNDLSDKKNVSLRDIVDKNLKINLLESIKPRPDLVDNFHWVIMRIRRARHISREQFAKDLGESETLIKMIEQGILPEDDNKIINKIEGYLGIKLRKSEFGVKEEPREKELGFDSVSATNLTISDLREMKKKKEEEIFSKSVEVWDGDIEVDSKEKEKEEDSDEEDLIFGEN